MQFLRRLLPSTLKNRIFLSFLVLIFIPFTLLQLRSFYQVESTLQRNVSEQNLYQLEQLKRSFADLLRMNLLTIVQMEKDPEIREILRGGNKQESEAMSLRVTEKFKEMKSELFLAGDYVYYTLSDFHGGVYTSYANYDDRLYDNVMLDPSLKALNNSATTYSWETGPDRIHTPLIGKAALITFHSLFRDEQGDRLGYLRVSVDYNEWLKANAKYFPNMQSFVIVDDRGNELARTNQRLFVQPKQLSDFLSRPDPEAYLIDDSNLALINKVQIPSVNWYLIGQFPLQLYFGDVAELNKQFFITFITLAAIFIVIAFLILSTITRPLHLLQRHMSGMVSKGFKIRIQTAKYQGEILRLAETFNQMAEDMNKLIEQLKAEERQKEAIRFQMLLQQMNPHFLLNTLNTIKWNALSHEDHATAEMCISLGKLLETSLNSELELIHLQDELELVQSYVYIQNSRFDQKFEVHYEYDDQVRYVLVPKLSLQPLVENAITHGFAHMKEGGKIAIRVYPRQRHLVIEIEDNGQGLKHSGQDRVRTRASRSRNPIGLSNVQERLQLLFKNEGGLELLPLATGTLARMRFPLLISEPYQDGGGSNVESAASGR